MHNVSICTDKVVFGKHDRSIIRKHYWLLSFSGHTGDLRQMPRSLIIDVQRPYRSESKGDIFKGLKVAWVKVALESVPVMTYHSIVLQAQNKQMTWVICIDLDVYMFASSAHGQHAQDRTRCKRRSPNCSAFLVVDAERLSCGEQYNPDRALSLPSPSFGHRRFCNSADDMRVTIMYHLGLPQRAQAMRNRRERASLDLPSGPHR